MGDRLFRRTVILAIGACVLGCGSDSTPTNTSRTELRGHVAGYAMTGDSVVLEGVHVTARTLLPNDMRGAQFHPTDDEQGVVGEAVTLADGTYSLEVPSGWIVLQFEHDGYARTYRTRNVAAERRAAVDVDLPLAPAPFEFAMPQIGDADAILTFNSEAGRDYARLRIEPGDLLREDGSPVEGFVTARVDAVHPRDRHKDAFLASDHVMQESGPPLPLRAAGIISVELEDADGRLEVAPGQTLDWEIDVAAEQRAGVRTAWAESAVHNYSLDTRTGMWLEDPAKLRFDGETLTVQRSHFSTAAVGYTETRYAEDANCVDPGRHAVILLTFSNPRTPPEVAEALVKTSVEYVSQVDHPSVLVVLDDNNHGEYVDDAAYIAKTVQGLGFDVDLVDEPTNGLSEGEIAGYDVVWLVNPGYPIDDILTLETLEAHREAGGGFVLSGDDIVVSTFQTGVDTSPYTFLDAIDNGATTCGYATDNNAGESYRVTFTEGTGHLMAAGLEGVSFLYGDDIDHSSPVGDGEHVLAWAELEGHPECNVRIPVVMALDLGDSSLRPACSCGNDNDCLGEQHCVSNECQSCSVSGATCTEDTECCASLTCNAGICGDPCGNEGSACVASGNCCGSLGCSDGVCGMCAPDGDSCANAADCCGDLSCIDGACGSCRATDEPCGSASDCCGSAACEETTEVVAVSTEECSGEAELVATVRDFRDSHPDFQYRIASDIGIVESLLGDDGKPVYAGDPDTQTTTGATNFDQWYRDAQGVNTPIDVSLTLEEVEPGLWQYRNNAFFPIDGVGFGNEGRSHNYHFTLELHTEFIYRGGETFTFTGDDDLFAFINGRLAIDLGGVHAQLSRTVDLDQAAANLQITPGNEYTLDIFFAERHTSASNFRIDTTIGCLSNVTEQVEVTARCVPRDEDDPDCGGYDTPVIGLDAVTVVGTALVAEGAAAANVGSNGTVTLADFGRIEGTATSAEAQVTVYDDARVQGGTREGRAPFVAEVPEDAFDRSRYVNNNADYGLPEQVDATVTEGEFFLTAGDYSLGAVEISGTAVVRCEGKVRLFVSGAVVFGRQARVNNDGGCDLSILSESADGVSLGGGAAVNAAIYAPRSQVALTDSATLYGAVVGREVALSGAATLTADGDAFQDTGVCDPDDPPDDTGGTTGDDDGGDTELPPLPDLPD